MKINSKILMTVLLLFGLSLPLVYKPYALAQNSYEDPKQDFIKKLDGARYLRHVDSAVMKTDDELVINGATLIWKSRVTWARPDIAQSMASGTNGFRQRKIGTWEELERMQIVGQEARFHSSAAEIIYTISEDGNSITEKVIPSKGGSQTFIFRRVSPVAAPPAHKAAPAPAPQTAAAPAPAKKTAAAAMAQVEARGEFYFLTKDGRKLTGAEANKVPLEEGGKVVTGRGGHVRLTLPDDTTWTVGPNSDLVIDTFVYDADRTPKKVMVDMTKGVFRWVTGKVRAAQKEFGEMQLTLPIMAVGIRGTDFEAVVEPSGKGRVALYAGQLEITETESGFTFLLNAGQMVTFSPDGKVSRPKKIKGANILGDRE